MSYEDRYCSHDDSSIECIDAIKAALTREEFVGFCKGNVIKYIWRERDKGRMIDIGKAAAYINYILGGKNES